jgi:DNA invertase Pin-like site-specific DNA recombinase
VKYPKDLKGFKPVVYLRISTDEQSPQDEGKPLEKRENLKRQLKAVSAWLKANGLTDPKADHVHYELASGGDPTRPVLARAIEQAVGLKGKRMFVVAELSRFTRDLRHGLASTIPLYENGIPLVVTDDGLITGTKDDPEGDNDILMGLKISLATGERERLRKRVQKSIERNIEEGIFNSKGLELYPDAQGDMYEYWLENLPRLASKKDGGWGATEWLKLSSVVYGGKPPFGSGLMNSVFNRLSELKANMTVEEFNEWNSFRKRILNMERAFGVDDWRMKAVRYRVNGYLTKPLEYAKPTEEVIQGAIDNPAENLSFKLFKQYRKEVSKRGQK